MLAHPASIMTPYVRPAAAAVRYARGVQCVGRLDEDTTGLLLLSDDGAWLHALASPAAARAQALPCVQLKHALDDTQQCTRLLEGVILKDDPVPVAALALSGRLAENELEITIDQGRYHQVKRMLAAVGNRVEAPAPCLRSANWCWARASWPDWRAVQWREIASPATFGGGEDLSFANAEHTARPVGWVASEAIPIRARCRSG